MIEVLTDRTYRHLFAAQVIALLGAGLATLALGLLADDLAGTSVFQRSLRCAARPKRSVVDLCQGMHWPVAVRLARPAAFSSSPA